MEEKEVVLTPEQANLRMQFLTYLNNRFYYIYKTKYLEKWRKDGMWDAIISGKIVENTKRKRAMQNGK